MVARGEFREDLFYRINVATVHVPALRERLDDVPALIAHVAARAGSPLAFSDDAMASLSAYRWPGNVRELRNVVEGLSALVGRRQVEARDLPAPFTAPTPASQPERRRTIAADLHEGLTGGRLRFWDDVHRMFEQRDITRADLRRLIGMGLEASFGSYRGLLRRYGMAQRDHRRLLQFLAAHDCAVDARAFRPPADGLLLPVRGRASGRTA
jgi:DNA-binding NtrC family response regulator